MERVNVLQEILEWSQSRPEWQRDALRRLVSKGELADSDIRELANLCKSRHGLGDRETPVPLNANHLPKSGAETKPVLLQSLTHHAGVNALAQDQTIQFGGSLTVVYGANAAGKSGYTRVLKRACRARGAEEILGNVVSGTAPGRPSATIKFTANEKSHDHLWDDDQLPNPILSRVSVFDHHCASVYVSQQTDVAFRPLGLDLFDKLSAACEAVKKALEKEREALEILSLKFPNVDYGTAVHDLVTNLTPLTDPATVHELAILTDCDRRRRDDIRNRIRDLTSEDPKKTARAVELRAARAKVLVERVTNAQVILSDTEIGELFTAHEKTTETQRVLETLQRETFREQPLLNTGSAAWRTLWNAAEKFSTTNAYPDRAFPYTEEGSRCVLCQQQLNDEGMERLQQFREFVGSTAQREHEMATDEYNRKRQQFKDAVVLDDKAMEVLEELKLDDDDLFEAIQATLKAAEARRELVDTAITESLPAPTTLPGRPLDVSILTDHIESLENRVNELRKAEDPEAISKLRTELGELEAREVLAENLSTVLEEIERKKKIAVYQMCINETRTNSITRKSSDVTRRAVTEQLTRCFSDELDGLRFHHVEVQMVDTGGSRGALYHKLQLRRAPGVDVSKVASEGEARCLSIASFFAELSTAADRSAILFDDPVSSLDHSWRENVAKRLVVESKSRQVIIFTHDMVFLVALVEKASELDVELQHQYLRRDNTAAGLSSQELPWAALKVRDRIGRLNALWQDAERTFRNGDSGKYEKDASYIYGLLREAWERGVEEVLLAGTVERYRNSVQTQRANQLADICDNDIGTLNIGMTKCSKWLTGHDQSLADNSPIPGPNEVKEDIDALATWIQNIRKRRGN